MPVDFYLGVSFSRDRLLEVPAMTQSRMGPRYKVLEINWEFLLRWTLIFDLKRVYFASPIGYRFHRIQPVRTCQPNRFVSRMKEPNRDFDEAV